MRKMQTIISLHNKKLLSNNKIHEGQPCNSRQKSECPLAGKCCTKGVIYKANVETNDDNKIYIGSTGDTFKRRYYNHIASFKDRKKELSTELSKYIWQLKDNKSSFKITWSISRHARYFKPNVRGLCSICNMERITIARADKKKMLNKRSELTGKCKHFRSLYS